MATEDEFPTIAQFAEGLVELVKKGLGEQPAQVLIVPDSTMQTAARILGGGEQDRPALMIDLTGDNRRPGQVPVTMISTAALFGSTIPTRTN